MINKLRILVASSILIAAGSLSACAGGDSSEPGANGAPKHGGTVVISANGAASLDPVSPVWPNGTSYGYQIYGSLFRPGGSGGSELEPELATGYTYSPDFKTLTIKLRENVKFQDGTAFNADAVAFNIKRDAEPTSTLAQYFTTLDSVEAPDASTVVLHLKQPTPHLIYIFASTNAAFVVSPTALQNLGAEKFGLMPIGAGPFKVVKNNPTIEQDLKAWSGYWDADHRYLDGLKFLKVSVDPSVQYSQLSSGSLQSWSANGAYGVPSILNQAKNNKKISFHQGDNLTYLFLPVNTSKPPFDNEAARQAIDYCTDRESIAKNVQEGWAKPAYVLAGTSMRYYPSSGSGSVDDKIAAAKALMPYQYDPEKGAALVKSLPGGELNFEFNVLQGRTQSVATALAQQWAECGIHANLKVVAFAEAFESYTTGNYQLSTSLTGGVFQPDITILPYSTSNGSYNKYGLHSSDLDNLFSQAAATSDETKLPGIWSQIFQMQNTLGINIPIISGGSAYFYDKCLDGLSYIQAGVIFGSAYYKC